MNIGWRRVCSLKHAIYLIALSTFSYILPDDVILQIALMHIGSCILKLSFEMLTLDGCLLIVMAFNCPIII